MCPIAGETSPWYKFEKIISKLNDKMGYSHFSDSVHHFRFLIDTLIYKSSGINEKSIFFAGRHYKRNALMRNLPREFYRNNLMNIDYRLLAKQLYLSWPPVSHIDLYYFRFHSHLISNRLSIVVLTRKFLYIDICAILDWCKHKFSKKLNENISHRVYLSVLFLPRSVVTFETVSLIEQAFINWTDVFSYEKFKLYVFNNKLQLMRMTCHARSRSTTYILLHWNASLLKLFLILDIA